MPSMMDAPELVAHVATHDLTSETRERPQPQRVRLGCWRTLAHQMTRYLAPTPREQRVASCSVHCPFEAPMDRLVREYPSLAVYALALI